MSRFQDEIWKEVEKSYLSEISKAQNLNDPRLQLLSDYESWSWKEFSMLVHIDDIEHAAKKTESSSIIRKLISYYSSHSSNLASDTLSFLEDMTHSERKLFLGKWREIYRSKLQERQEKEKRAIETKINQLTAQMRSKQYWHQSKLVEITKLLNDIKLPVMMMSLTSKTIYWFTVDVTQVTPIELGHRYSFPMILKEGIPMKEAELEIQCFINYLQLQIEEKRHVITLDNLEIFHYSYFYTPKQVKTFLEHLVYSDIQPLILDYFTDNLETQLEILYGTHQQPS